MNAADLRMFRASLHFAVERLDFWLTGKCLRILEEEKKRSDAEKKAHKASLRKTVREQTQGKINDWLDRTGAEAEERQARALLAEAEAAARAAETAPANMEGAASAASSTACMPENTPGTIELVKSNVRPRRRFQGAAKPVAPVMPATEKTPPVPSLRDPEALKAWVRDVIGEDRLVLHPRALRTAQNSLLQDESLALEGLRLLGQHYCEMRRSGDRSLKAIFDQRAAELGLKNSHTKAELGGKYLPEYQIDYNGRKLILDRHLTRGVSRQPENCLRIYYTWDRETERIVVGSLPGHLTNRLT